MTSSPSIDTRVPVADPYAHSRAVSLLRSRLRTGAPLRLACLDIDSTLTGDPERADAVRTILGDSGHVVMFDTSRSEEMILSSASFAASSRDEGIARPAPHLGQTNGKRAYMPPEQHEPWGVLDGDIIAGSTGTRILVRQSAGDYRPDVGYERRYEEPADAWRQSAVKLVEEARARGCDAELAPIESRENYASGMTDIFPPTYRVQVNFNSVPDKIRFVACVRVLRAEGGIGRNVRLTDDSNPDARGFKLFITPRKGSKAHAVERVVDRLVEALDVERSLLHILFAGDSFPDLKMGLLGGLGTHATFLMVGGSRLAGALTDPRLKAFAGEQVGTIQRRMSPAGLAGRYRFRVPCARTGSRTLVIGDEAYPGTHAVETVYRYLTDANGGPEPHGDRERNTSR